MQLGRGSAIWVMRVKFTPRAGGEGHNHICEARMTKLLFLSCVGYHIFCQEGEKMHFLAQYDKKTHFLAQYDKKNFAHISRLFVAIYPLLYPRAACNCN
jgi:hypothetical protein